MSRRACGEAKRGMKETNISKIAVVLDSNDLLLVFDLPPPLVYLINNLANGFLGLLDVLKVRVVLRRVLDNILHEQGVFTDALDGLEEEGAQAEGPALLPQGSLPQECLEGLVLLQLVEKVHGIGLIAAVDTVHPKETRLRRRRGTRSELPKSVWRKKANHLEKDIADLEDHSGGLPFLESSQQFLVDTNQLLNV